MPWPFPRPLLKAEFIERPNRFIGVFRFAGERATHQAHIADPGRLKELLIPGATVYVVDYRDHPTRKLPFAMPVVEIDNETDDETDNGRLVSIYSRLPNAVFQYFFKHQPDIFPALQHHQFVRTEIPWQCDTDPSQKSRFDFLLKSPENKRTYIEVKGASLVEDRVCYFPDAVTARGAKQLRHLMLTLEQGHEAHVVFIVQRDDADEFRPNDDRDPVFAQALRDAIVAGVQVSAISIQLTPEGILFKKVVPVVI